MARAFPEIMIRGNDESFRMEGDILDLEVIEGQIPKEIDGLYAQTGALDCFIEQTKARKAFNLPYRTLAEMPSIQVTAAKARATVTGAQALLFSRAEQLDQMQLAVGSSTISEKNPIQRFARDAPVALTHGSTPA